LQRSSTPLPVVSTDQRRIELRRTVSSVSEWATDVGVRGYVC
jgi:hypothetical protein